MDSELLARYLAGEADAADSAKIKAWATSDPEHRAELGRLEAAWATPPRSADWNVDQAWAKIVAQLNRPQAPATVIPIRRAFPVRWLVAAAVILAAGAGLWSANRNHSIEYRTGVGEQRQLSLADGSTVTMAPTTILIVDPQFGQPNRALRLTGRAWFVVTHDANRPFTVTTDGAMIEDLGTEFEINATGPMTKVAVAVGAVAVHRTGAPTLTLGAGDLATVASGGAPQVAHAMPIDRLSSWRAGTLDFIDRPLVEVAAELERWYDVSIAVDPTVGAKLFNGPIPTDDLEQALATIETAFTEVRLVKTGRNLALGLKGLQ